MKDMYSFHASEKDFEKFYFETVPPAYTKIFERCGLKAFFTLAAGGDFTANNTHEFQVAANVGEDTIYACGQCGYAENKEISKLKDGGKCPKCGGIVKEEKTIEVGNIFPLGTKYSEAFNLRFLDEKGEKRHVIMGSYGIGVSRLVGVIVEKYNDAAGILWPESIAPFRAHLLALNGADGEKIYETLQTAGVEVLFDERNLSAGEKFAEADLIGIPWRLVVSPKTKSGMVEIKKRGEKDSKTVDINEALKILSE
jgi:prolyl-tRNA synthetase